MDKFITVAQVVAPIFITVFLGMFARQKKLVTAQQVQGLQQYVMKFGLPCLLFNSCLGAKIGAESLSTMVPVLPLMVLSSLWAFRFGRKRFPYHNLPQLFAAQETGMLGIPLFMILFGTAEAYRVGVLDLAQAPAAIPTIAILSASAGENLSPGQITKKVFSSPFLVMSLLGLGLNLTGIGGWMDSVGVGSILTKCMEFIGQPVSAMMIFSVGYNFSLEKKNLKPIAQISLLHLAVQTVFCLFIQGLLFLVPNVDSLSRWAILLYCTLPASYIAPGLGRTEEDTAVASGVCSVLTVVSLIVFCFMAAAVA